MEFKGIDLGDKRLNRRAVLLAEQLSGNPTASIPQACGGWAETAAAYRFFAQDKLEWADIMEPHWQSSAQRMRASDVGVSANPWRSVSGPSSMPRIAPKPNVC
ncbi:IS4/Tn5 family transposase DNA-binding protein [Burkholderia sp. PAMC 28687]|nr:transposase DNA-binding-containing protein [Burkholderia sp. PAMC 28687]